MGRVGEGLRGLNLLILISLLILRDLILGVLILGRVLLRVLSLRLNPSRIDLGGIRLRRGRSRNRRIVRVVWLDLVMMFLIFCRGD